MILYKNKKKKLDIGGILEGLGSEVGEDAAEDAASTGANAGTSGGNTLSTIFSKAQNGSSKANNLTSTLSKINQFSDPIATLSQNIGASYWNKQGDRYGLDAVTTSEGADKAAQAITAGSALTPFSAEGEGIGNIIKGFGTSTTGNGVLQPYGIKYKTYNSGQRVGDVAGGVTEAGTSAVLTAFGVPAPIANAIGKEAGKIIQAPASIVGDNVKLSKKNLSDAGQDLSQLHIGKAFQDLGQDSSNQERQIEQRRIMRDVTGIKQNQALQTGFQQYATLLPKYDKNVMTRYASRGGRLFSPLYNEGGSLIKPSHRGRFTAWAKAHGMGVQEAAAHVMANKDKYDSHVVEMANFAKNFGGKHEEGGVLDPRQRTNTLSGMGQFMQKGGRLHDEVITHLRNAFATRLKGGGSVDGGSPWNNSGNVTTEKRPGYSSYYDVHDAIKSILNIKNGYPALKNGGGITNGGKYKNGGDGFPKFGSMQPVRSPLFYYHGGAIILGGQLHAEENKKNGAGNPIYASGQKVAETERGELLLNKEQTEQLEHHIKEYDRTGHEDHLHRIGNLMQHVIKNETVDSTGKILKKKNGGEIRFPKKNQKTFYQFSDGR